MMESQNLGAEGQISDASQQIGDGSKMVVGGSLDAVEAVADGRVKVELGSGGGEVAKRKRGRPPKALAKPPQPKPPPAKKIKEEEKKEEEDVCFICFDGGSLVLCDRRGCPKAYHPACIKRDEAFFESAAKWNCGWHICSICQKTAHHMCYTCTYSLCRGCIRKADYVCVRGDKGFCTVCMKTIMLIENNGQGEDGKVQADFDDKLSWEYLFKVYWVYLKGKLSLTLNELTEAKNPWKVATELSSVVPSTDVHHIPNDLTNMTSATSIDNSEEANECKRRKIDEQINTQKETVNMEKSKKEPKKDESASMEWATKELLDFVAHMKNGNTSVLSRFDVQALTMEYINRNNLRDPKRKNQIICDSRLKSLFGKPRVGHIQMLKLLEYHFLVKEDSQKKRANRTVVNRTVVNRTAVQVDPDWSSDNLLTVGRDKKRKNCSKGVERVLQNKLDEFAAVDVHNINLVYLRRDLMENLLDDSDNFHGKVVGSIVRIRISGCDLKHDMYRLVQVVGTSKVDVPYKINSKSTDIMLEVLNLDKKETISIDAISDQEFSEEECRRLQRSIRCGLVEHFTVGQIQEKAVALQSIKLNDWIEREILRLNHLRDVASEKGHKKGYRECVEKLQLLKTPEERERRLNEIPEVHSDPKMNPDYESDDTEEYFNKEHGDQMESKYSGTSSKNSRSPKRRSRKDEKPMSQRVTTSPNVKPMNQRVTTSPNVKPMNQRVTTSPNVEDESTKPLTVGIDLEKDASASTLEKSPHEIDCNGSTVTKLEPQPTLSTSVSNSAPETVASKITSVPSDPILWHYLDPNGKVQGPFSLVQLQRWSTTGYFPTEMRIWSKHEDESLLLSDVLKEHFNNYQNVTATAIATTIATATATATSTSTSTAAAATSAGASSKQIEGLNVCSEIPSSTVVVTQNPVNNEKLSDSQLGQNWSGNNNNNNLNYNPPSVESTVQLETSNMTQETEKNEADIKHAPATTLVELPGPSPKKIQSVLDSKALVQDSGNPPSWSTTASSLVAGEPKLPVSGNGWGGGCSSTPVKREEWDSGLVLEVAGDHVATPTSNIDQSVNPSQPTCNDFTTWHGMGEMIEFSTLAEESVSDLLAEVDAMESQYGLPSPTSRRNSFVDDLFNGSFDEFSPTPDQGTRSDGFSSSGDIQLPCQSTTTTTTPDEHPSINAFDFMKTSNGLHQHSFISPEINCQTQTAGVTQKTNSGNMGFKWPEMERASQGMIDINRSAKAEGDEGEMETKTSEGKMENGNYNMHQPIRSVDNGILHNLESSGEMRSGEHVKEMQVPKTIGIGAKLVTRVAQIKGLESTTNHRRVGGVPAKEEEDGEFIPPQPQPPPRAPPLTLGLDPYDPCDLGSETFQDKFNKPGQGTNMVRVGNIGWDSNQRKYGGERYNSSSSSSPRERSHQVEESGYSRSSRSSWNKQSSLGSGSGSGAGGGGFSKLPPSKGQRVCRFYESGRCKKGASCKYLHPSP